MAGVATAAYAADTLPSPGGVDASQWDFAVPLGNEENQPPSRPRHSNDSNLIRAKSNRKRHSNGSRSSSVSRNVHSHESPYLNSGRGRRDHSVGRRGSEVGSMRDASGYDGSSRKDSEEAKDGLKLYLEGEMSQEKWIHRDKLAKIESEELHQAAILFQRRMRGESKSSGGRGRSHDSQQSTPYGTGTATSPAAEFSEPWPEMRGEPGKRGVNNYVDVDERRHWDLRRPEEIAADDAAVSIYSNPSLGKSASRIPVSTASPVPIPGMGRDSRGPRSRAATDEDDRSSRGRRASEPINIDQDGSTTSPGSRPGSRGFGTNPNTAGKKNPRAASGSTNRKTSAPPTNRKTSTARSRAVSNNTSQRPTTRGNESRPTTAANRPEGDPPWLATMYKPDPRLPPEQQMLPTLAKKMQQEQWEKEGRTPNTYDRNFAPLAVHPFDAPPVPPKSETEPQPEPEQQPTENLQLEEFTQPPKSPEPLRPNTSMGYSTMPKVQDTPPMGLIPNPNPNWNPPVVTAREQPKKEKSCGCCIVM